MGLARAIEAPVLCRGDLHNILEGAVEVGVGVETAAVGHFFEAHLRVRVQQVLCPLNFKALDVGGRVVTGECDNPAV